MSMTQINWYPGHMKKTKDLIEENLKLIDVVLEIVDARIPLSSKNPNIASLSKNKKRIIVLGIPNVGKSRLINRIVGKNSAAVGNKPGFTRGKQWVRIKEGIELLDTPGILWPKFESETVGINLAITGAIRDEILPIEDVACSLLKKMLEQGRWESLKERYKLLEEDRDDNVLENILSKIALRMAMLNKGGELNILQAAYTLLRDYRVAKLGKFGLDEIKEV